MCRKCLLAASAVCCLCAVLSGHAFAAVVGIARAVSDDEIESAVREAVRLAGGLPAGMGFGRSVVIQPNLVGAGVPSGTGVITDVRVARAVIRLVLETGVSPKDITLCEGSAGFVGSRDGYGEREMTWKAFRDCGLDADGDRVEDAFGVRLADANDAGMLYPDFPTFSGPYNTDYVTRIFRPFLIDRVYVIPNLVAECDFLIRLPLVKNHRLAGITGALKLAGGFAPSDVYHASGSPTHKINMLHQTSWGRDELTTNAMSQADLTLCRPPDFAVMDGLVGIINGPMGGPTGNSGGPAYPHPDGPMRVILAGSDPVALDTIETLACGYRTDMESVPGLYYSALQQLGTNDPAEITVSGAHVAEIRRWFPPWGSADEGNRTPPELADISVDLQDGRLLVTPIGASDTEPGLCKAELYVDGVLTATSTAEPFAVECSTMGAASGEHEVTYVLYDGMLNESSETRTVSISGGNPIGGVLSLEDGEQSLLGPVVFSGKAPQLGSSTFFVGNSFGTSGLRVDASGPAPAFSPGRSIVLAGYLETIDGQRVFRCSSCDGKADGAAPSPKFMLNRSLGGQALNPDTPGVSSATGPYNVGCLVRTTGAVLARDAEHFTISDGSLSGGVRALCRSFASPEPGAVVDVTGFSCVQNGRALLVPRSADDVVVLSAP